mgnify:CR=1 FL=1
MKSDQPRYAIRKYAVGAASVLIGFFAGAQVVAADTPTTTESPSTQFQLSQARVSQRFPLMRKLLSQQ